MNWILTGDPSELLLLALETTVKGSILLAAAALATSLLKNAPAAVRHTVWTTALVGVAILPIVVATAPKYDVPVLPYSSDEAIASTVINPPSLESVEGSFSAGPATGTSLGARNPSVGLMARSEARPPRSRDTEFVASSRPVLEALPAMPAAESEAAGSGVIASPASGTFDWQAALLALWACGVAVVALRFAAGWFALRRIRRTTEPVADVRFRLAAKRVASAMGLRRRIRLVWGHSGGMPLTWGWFRPTVLIPTDAREWTVEKVLAVLHHELAHIKRRDCLVQGLVYIVCAIHWFNPLVWVAASNSRRDREMACDDYVLRSGTTGSAYADHLLQIARALKTPAMSGVSTIAMARPTELEGRLMAILNPNQHRNENSRKGLMATATFLLAFSLPLAVLRPVPQDVESPAQLVEAESAQPEAEPGVEIDAEPADIPVVPAVPTVAGSLPVAEVPPPALAEMPTVEALEAETAAQVDYILQANELVEKAARTLESLERLGPVVSTWQSEFGESITPLILDELVAHPDTISLSQIRRLKSAGVDVEYIEELAAVGLDRLTVDELVGLAHAGVDAEYVLKLQTAGYRDLSPKQLLQLSHAGIDPEDIAVWAELGYDELSTQELIHLAHADVDAEFVMALGSLGYDLDPNEIVRMSHADVDADYISRMAQFGLDDLSVNDLIRLGHADVDAWYIDAMQKAGYDELFADDLIRMVHADVDPWFVQELANAGYTNVSVEDLIRLGHADVDAGYVMRLRAAGLGDITTADLIKLAHAEVDAKFVNELKEVGVEIEDVDELVRLKYMDIDPEYIRRIREAAGN